MYTDLLADCVEPLQTAIPVVSRFLPPTLVDTPIRKLATHGRLVVLHPQEAEDLSAAIFGNYSAQEVMSSVLQKNFQQNKEVAVRPVGVYHAEVEIQRMVYVTDFCDMFEVTCLGRYGKLHVRKAAQNIMQYCNGHSPGTQWVPLSFAEGPDQVVCNPKAREMMQEKLKPARNYHPYADVGANPQSYISVGHLAMQTFTTFTSPYTPNEAQRLEEFVNNFSGSFFQVLRSEEHYDVFLHLVPESVLQSLFSAFYKYHFYLQPTIIRKNVNMPINTVFLGVLAMKSKLKHKLGLRLLACTEKCEYVVLDLSTLLWSEVGMQGADLINSDLSALLKGEKEAERTYKATMFFPQDFGPIINAVHWSVLQTLCPRYRNGGYIKSNQLISTHYFNPYSYGKRSTGLIAQSPQKCAIKTLSASAIKDEYHKYCDDREYNLSTTNTLENFCDVINSKHKGALSSTLKLVQIHQCELFSSLCEVNLHSVLAPLVPPVEESEPVVPPEATVQPMESLAEATVRPTGELKEIVSGRYDFSTDEEDDDSSMFSDSDSTDSESPYPLETGEGTQEQATQDPPAEEKGAEEERAEEKGAEEKGAEEERAEAPPEEETPSQAFERERRGSGEIQIQVLEPQITICTPPAQSKEAEGTNYIKEMEECIEDTIERIMAEQHIIIAPLDDSVVNVEVSTEEPPPLPPKKATRKRTYQKKKTDQPKRVRKPSAKRKLNFDLDPTMVLEDTVYGSIE